MKKLIWVGLLLASTGPAMGNAELVRCVQEHVTVQAEMGERMPTAIALLTVTNDLSHAISGISYRIQIMEQGRSVPWVDTEVGLDIAGGIEPHETRTLRTRIPQFRREAGDDLQVNVTILEAVDAHNVPISGTKRYVGQEAGPSELGCP